MPPTDPGHSDYQADARGIMQCLRMLTEEAAGLRLAHTCEALRQALDICAMESGLVPIPDAPIPDKTIKDTTVADGADSPATPPLLH